MVYRKTITAHCLIRNEENFVGYAIRSVINYVDKVLVYDTGSTDKTASVIEEIQSAFPGKIIFEQKGYHDRFTHTNLRQEMLEATDTDWFMIIDGDEVWTKTGMEEAVGLINDSSDVNYLIAPYYLCVGDVYHTYYKEKYDFFYRRKGFFTPRFIKYNKNLVIKGDYELDTFYNKSTGKMVYNQNELNILTHGFWHLTHLRRSSRDDEVFTSGIAKNRGEKRRLTHFLIGREIKESIPGVFDGLGVVARLTFWQSFINFWQLVFNQPKLLSRRLKYYLKFGRE